MKSITVHGVDELTSRQLTLASEKMGLSLNELSLHRDDFKGETESLRQTNAGDWERRKSFWIPILMRGDTTVLETAEIFGRLKSGLKKQSTPVPINDLWIAAHAIETGSFFLTFDSHFQSIPEVLKYQSYN